MGLGTGIFNSIAALNRATLGRAAQFGLGRAEVMTRESNRIAKKFADFGSRESKFLSGLISNSKNTPSVKNAFYSDFNTLDSFMLGSTTGLGSMGYDMSHDKKPDLAKATAYSMGFPILSSAIRTPSTRRLMADNFRHEFKKLKVLEKNLDKGII